jgi:hypothetical protein
MDFREAMFYLDSHTDEDFIQQPERTLSTFLIKGSCARSELVVIV